MLRCDILGTIYSDNPNLLNKLVTKNQDAYTICSSSIPVIKTSASAAAGSAADLPRLEHKLTGTTKPCMPGTTGTEVIPKTSAAACRALSGTTKPHQITDTNPITVHSSYSAQSPATLVKQKPAYMNQGNIEIRELHVNVTRLTKTDITKHTAKRQTFVKSVKLVLHKLPLVVTQSVTVASPKTSSEPKTHSPTRVLSQIEDVEEQTKKLKHKWKTAVPMHKISGHLSSDKQHMFHVKHHVFKKRIRKLYLKCRVRNCKQAFRSFHSVKTLIVHHRIFHAKTLFKCLICPKKHCTPSSVHFHKYEHQIPAFTCATCNKSFVFNSKLQQHLRVHKNKNCTTAFMGVIQNAASTLKI